MSTTPYILKNTTDSEQVWGGMTIASSSQYNIQSVDFDLLNTDQNFLTDIGTGDAVINDGVQDLTESQALEILNFKRASEGYNPSLYTYMEQANIINNIFLNHTEDVLLEDALKNTIVDTYKGQSKTDSYSNVSFSGSGIELYGNTSSVFNFEDFEDVSDWDPSSQTTIETDGTIVHEGTYSGKYTISSLVPASKWSQIQKDLSTAQDWTSYTELKLWVYGEGNGERVRIEFLDDISNQYYVTTDYQPKEGWQQIDFDISLANRKEVSVVRIQTQKNISSEVIVYFDQFQLTDLSSYVSTGHIITKTVEVSANIKEIYYNDYVDLPEGSSYTAKISLDDGGTYHTLDVDGLERRNWIDVSTWSEYDSFSNLKNLKLRFDLSTTDTSVTPLLDDYMVMWKLDTGDDIWHRTL